MGTDAGTGLPKQTEVFARNLAEVIEDNLEAAGVFLPSISCICEGEEGGLFPEKWSF